jgi:hypothetical protein
MYITKTVELHNPLSHIYNICCLITILKSDKINCKTIKLQNGVGTLVDFSWSKTLGARASRCDGS